MKRTERQKRTIGQNEVHAFGSLNTIAGQIRSYNKQIKATEAKLFAARMELAQRELITIQTARHMLAVCSVEGFHGTLMVHNSVATDGYVALHPHVKVKQTEDGYVQIDHVRVEQKDGHVANEAVES